MTGRIPGHDKAIAPRSAGRAGREAARSNPGTRAGDATVANRARQEGMRQVGPRGDRDAAAAGDDGPGRGPGSR